MTAKPREGFYRMTNKQFDRMVRIDDDQNYSDLLRGIIRSRTERT